MAKQPFQKMSDEDYIVSFCDITGASVEEAGMYLEMSGFDLDKAISLYFDNGIQPRNPLRALGGFTTVRVGMSPCCEC